VSSNVCWLVSVSYLSQAF